MITPGERIRQERLRQGLSIPQLAAAAGVGERTVARIERGERDSNLRFLLEEYLGISGGTADAADQTGERPPDDVIEAALDHATPMQLLTAWARLLSRLDPSLSLPEQPLRWPRTDDDTGAQPPEQQKDAGRP